METIYACALQEAGIQGRFQTKYRYVYNCFMIFAASMAYMNLILILAIPKHNCRLPPRPVNISDEQWKLKYLPKVTDTYGRLVYSSCEMFKESRSNETLQLFVNFFYVSLCPNGYEYDQTWYETTAVSHFNWVCDKEIYAANIFAYSKMSEVVGGFTMGWIGDAYGRRIACLTGTFLMVFGRTISILSQNSFFLFVTGCVIAAFPSLSVTNSILILSTELSRVEETKKCFFFQSIGLIFGTISMALLYWWLRDWWSFFIITNIPLSLGFLYSWEMIESPKWLLVMGENEKCIQQLEVVANYNSRKLHEDTKYKILSCDSPKEKNVGPLGLFSSWTLAKNTILLITCWISMSIIMVTVVLSSTEDSDSSNPFLLYVWQVIMEMCGYILATLFVDRIGRRRTAMIGFSLSGLLSLVSALRLYVKSAWAMHWLLNALILGLSKTFITVAYNTANIINMELYPVCLRQTGMAIGGLSANAAATLPAYIIFLGRNYNAKLPGLILTLTAVIGGASVFLLPETWNVKLPDTLEEARTFGKTKNKYMPVPRKEDSEKNMTEFANKEASELIT